MLMRDGIYQSIRSAILTCEFEPGQELREQILAERFRVSRSPVRDALLRLEQENLIIVMPRQGYRVKPISGFDVQNIFALRLLIQPACAEAAAGANDADLRMLDRYRNCADELRDETDFVEHNKSFHHAIEVLSGNRLMAEIARDLDEQFERLVRFSLRAFQLEQVGEALEEHEAIIDALQAHDAERASRLTSEHVANGHSRIMRALPIYPQQWDNNWNRSASQYDDSDGEYLNGLQ